MSFLSRLFSVCAVSLIAFGALTGCGIGTVDTSTPPTNYVAGAMHGRVMGGASPILNETVSVYVTSSSGYGTSTPNGAHAWQQQASTGSTGTFTFTGGYNCPAGQFVYLVAAGGNTGANAVNSNAVLVAALGRCEDLFSGGAGATVGAYTGGSVDVNELTTIAAAYALGAFSKVSGTGASTIVQIGSSSTNNAAQISGISQGCVAGVGSCTTTAAAGLYHAFLNAANLVTPTTVSTSFSANSTTTSYTGQSGAGIPAVPLQLINSMANSLVACVNSAGGAVGDGSACGQLLDLTTLPSGHVPPWTSATPTNTFSAMVNLAANPTLSGVTVSGTDCASGATANVACFFGIAQPTTNVYSPVLTSATGINDYSIAINYTSAPPANDSVGGVLITTSGAGYTSSTPVTFSTSPGTTATATLSPGAGGAITTFANVTMTANGSGYTTYATVTFSAPPSSSTATGTVASGATVPTGTSAVTISTGGLYTSAPAVSFTGCTTAPVATAALTSNAVSSVNVTTAGSGCSGTSVTFAAPPTAVGVALMNTVSSVCAAAPCQPLYYPLDGAVDINDNYYVGNTHATNTPSGNVYSFSSNGYIQSISTDQNTSGDYFSNMYNVTPDATGYVYYVNAGASSSRELGYVKQTNGIFSASTDENAAIQVNSSIKPYAMTVDAANNVWTFGIATSTSAATITKSGPGGTSPTTQATSSSLITGGTGGQSAVNIFVDPNQNIWLTDSTDVYVLSNTGSVASPTYGSTLITTADATGPSGMAFVQGAPYVAGNTTNGYTPIAGQYVTSTGMMPFSYTLSGVGVATVTAGTEYTSSSLKGPTMVEADGIGNVWVGDWKSGSVVNYSNLGTQTAYSYKPCLVVSSVCTSVFGASTVTSPASVAIDSTGSIWVPDPATNNVVQIIGAAAPTWPLLSLGKQGLEP